jgi:hypothetical protein
MIDRRDMLKLVGAGFVGLAVVGSKPLAPAQVEDAVDEPMRFSLEGDLGTVRASSGGETIAVSGHFAGLTHFTLR